MLFVIAGLICEMWLCIQTDSHFGPQKEHFREASLAPKLRVLAVHRCPGPAVLMPEQQRSGGGPRLQETPSAARPW